MERFQNCNGEARLSKEAESFPAPPFKCCPHQLLTLDLANTLYYTLCSITDIWQSQRKIQGWQVTQSHSFKVGLQFPVGHIHCLLKKGSMLVLVLQVSLFLDFDHPIILTCIQQYCSLTQELNSEHPTKHPHKISTIANYFPASFSALSIPPTITNTASKFPHNFFVPQFSSSVFLSCQQEERLSQFLGWNQYYGFNYLEMAGKVAYLAGELIFVVTSNANYQFRCCTSWKVGQETI